VQRVPSLSARRQLAQFGPLEDSSVSADVRSVERALGVQPAQLSALLVNPVTLEGSPVRKSTLLSYRVPQTSEVSQKRAYSEVDGSEGAACPAGEFASARGRIGRPCRSSSHLELSMNRDAGVCCAGHPHLASEIRFSGQSSPAPAYRSTHRDRSNSLRRKKRDPRVQVFTAFTTERHRCDIVGGCAAKGAP